MLFEIEPTTRMNLSNYIVNLDKSKFIQVIRNLISNALKFSPRGSTITMKLKLISIPSATINESSFISVNRNIDTDENKNDNSDIKYNCIQLSISDEGVGISDVSNIIYDNHMKY